MITINVGDKFQMAVGPVTVIRVGDSMSTVRWTTPDGRDVVGHVYTKVLEKSRRIQSEQRTSDEGR